MARKAATRKTTSRRTGKKTVRIGMIGAGWMSNNVHYPSLNSFDDVEFAGICDIDPERLKATADEYNIERRYADYQKMVEETAPDGVYVVGQPNIMYPIWIWCLEHGLNLFVEKPMGLTRHHARSLADLAAKNGCITQVGHQRRSSPLLKKMLAECLKRGPITHAVCEFYKCEPGSWYNAHSRMMGDCVHAIDTVRWMCGGEVVDVESTCKRIGGHDINWIGAMLHFDNGSTGFLINSWSSGRRVFRVQMHAPCVYVDAEVEAKAHLYADGDYEGKEYDCFEVAGGKTNWEAFGFRDKSREFIDSIKTGRETTSSCFRDAVKTMEVACQMLALAALNGE